MFAEEPRLVLRHGFDELRGRIAPVVRFDALWVIGDVAALAGPTVAIVGSRAPSDAGRRLAFETARALARAGACVISGLALGIDGAAHAGAVAENAPTVGVLGGGHRHFHPRRNRGLAQRMLAAGGAIVSPYGPDDPAYPSQFLQRNGVVAALADAVVIVEAAARSGALNTASWAADLGLPVFAFPGDVDRPKVAGCLALLRDGATLVRAADDILADLGLSAPSAGSQVRPSDDGFSESFSTGPARQLLALLSGGESDLDRLVEKSGVPLPAVIAALSALEIDGVVERRSGQRYAVAGKPGRTRR
jgi:DNA processing protein